MPDEQSTTPVETVLTAPATTPATSATDVTAPADTTTTTGAPETKGDGAITDPAAKADADKAGDTPGEYGDFVMPEGVEIDTAMMEKAVPVFKELGLTQDQAQKLVDFQAAAVADAAKAQVESFNTLLADWQDKSKNDPEFGGEHFQENVGVARLAVDKFGTPAFKQLMEDHGVGNHPEMVRFMLKIGRTLKEDVPGSTGGAVSGKTDRVSILYPQK